MPSSESGAPERKLFELQVNLGYFFNDVGLLELALTHSSYGRANNQRLEFLGDAVLSFVVAVKLYSHEDEFNEGDLTARRASLINNVNLADLASELGISDHLLLGIGERKTGGTQKQSVLSCAFEAVIAAIWLDGGLDPILTLLDQLMFGGATRVTGESGEFESAQLRHPKNRLQELLAKRGSESPKYRVVREPETPHLGGWKVACETAVVEPMIGEGKTKKLAETDAALQVLNKLEI